MGIIKKISNKIKKINFFICKKKISKRAKNASKIRRFSHSDKRSDVFV